MDPGSGQLTPAGLAAETVNPSFLAISPNHRFLYAVNEIDDFGGTSSGAVSAFAIEPTTGKLTLLNQESSRGSGPCHLIVDKQGKNVLVANYGGGSVAVLPIRPDGRLGPATAFIQHQGSSVNPQRQKEPHAHSMNLDAANRFAFAADLGLDKVLIYRFDPNHGTLAPNDPAAATVAPGSGPRHFAFHPSGHWAYVINEIASTITAFSYDAKTGALKTVQTVSTLPEGFTGNSSTAEIQVHPSGKFLYGSNRGDDSLAIFRSDPDTGRLTSVGRQPTQGKTPRGFGIDPTGAFLLAANQDSDSIVVFRIDPETGKLQPTGQVVEVPKPVCVQFIAVGR
jgi:6-phosphogluconolactonase